MITTKTEKKRPVYTVKCGNISVAIWCNRDDVGKPWYSFNITKSYQTTTGEWRNTNFFGRHDGLAITAAISEATKWINSN